jgi:hypothetical protein
MLIHDWTRVPAGLFHDFHQSWCVRIKDALNAGRLPKGIGALVEQRAGPLESHVLAIERRQNPPRWEGNGGVMTMPSARIVRQASAAHFADRANRVVIKHHLGRIIAVIEGVSPGNKDSRVALRDFVEKTVDFLRSGIHVLVIDLFPPTPRDPLGIHKAIWDEIIEEPFEFPEGKDRTLVSYQSGKASGTWGAYIEPLAVGDPLRDMELFLAIQFCVTVPLASTYQATWDASPEDLRLAVETGVMPEIEPE